MKSRKGKNGKKAVITSVAVVILLIVSFFMEKGGMWDELIDAAEQTTSANGKTASMTTDGESLLDAHFIDVGQGDCTLFISDGKSMLIDSGEAENADTVIKTVSEYGIESLDYVVATHAHSDHMGAMADIITEISVENIIISEPSEDSSLTATYEKFMDAVESSNANVILAEPEYTFTLGYANCTVLSPFNVDSSNENNNSIVMLITAGETSILMTGDAEKSVEKEIAAAYPDLDVDILKVGHHGSSTSSYADFIEQISPELGIIQCGLNNKYGHPTEKTIETLESAGVKYYRTDICGNISVHCTADGYTVEMKE